MYDKPVIGLHWIEGDEHTLVPEGADHPEMFGHRAVAVLCCRIVGKTWEECLSLYDAHLAELLAEDERREATDEDCLYE